MAIMNIKIILIIIAVAVLGLGGYFAVKYALPKPEQAITNFDECAGAGYPIMESYPAQCRTSDGRTFVQNVPPIKNILPQNGFLEGKITIGPLCPVEKIPPDPKCQPTPETYAAWPIAVYSSNQEIKIADIKPDATGFYKVELPAGLYVVNFELKIIFAKSLPKTVIVKDKETTTFDIDIDTGIR